MTTNKILTALFLFGVVNLFGVCTNKNSGGSGNPPVTPPPTVGAPIEYWLTKADRTVLLDKQSVNLELNSPTNSYSHIEVDSTTAYQTIDGFGYTLTGGSAMLINQMGTSEKNALLNELFGNGSNAISVSYLRVSIGASDLSPQVF